MMLSVQIPAGAHRTAKTSEHRKYTDKLTVNIKRLEKEKIQSNKEGNKQAGKRVKKQEFKT